MSTQNEDFLFAQEAQNLGYVTEAQVEEGFLLQQRMADDLQIDERLAVILVKRGWIADEQARRVYGIIEPEGARSQIEGYRLVQKVGRGAMGTVYKAIHKGLNRVVAIKILRRDLAADKTQIERLKREAKLLADLEHPNVVRALDAGESNGFPYLVMEFVEGDTLRDKIARDGPLDESDALRITRDLADALEKARRMGVVHRDVKPGNILIDKDGSPKLMDLGLAKGPIDAGLTQHGATVGTPQFMSPEQAESPEKADTRSDIYSLGATLYAMVTGRPPFEGTTLAEIITKVMSQQPVPPGMVNRDVSSEVSHLIERMMLKDASLRYATPALVIKDIDLIRGGQSIIPSGFQGNWEAYLLRKRFLEWRKRIVGGVAVAAVLIFGVVLWLQKQRTEVSKTALAAGARDALSDFPAIEERDSKANLVARRAGLEAARMELQELSDEAGVPFVRRDEIEDRLHAFKTAIAKLEQCEALAKATAEKRAQGLYRRARLLATEKKSDMHATGPSRLCWEKLVAELEQASARALEAGEARVKAMAASDINTFLEKMQARVELYGGDWIVVPGLAKKREGAKTARNKARTIGEALGRFNVQFADAAIAGRVDERELYNLRKEYGEAAQRLRTQVEAEVRTWPTVFAQEGQQVTDTLLREGGIISAAIERVDTVIDNAVERSLLKLKRTLGSLDPAEALAQLEAFVQAAERGSHYRHLAEDARAELKRISETVRSRREAERAAFDRARRKILAALREGSATRIRDAVKEALDEQQLSTERRAAVAALGEAASALEAMDDGAWQTLAERVGASSGSVTLQGVPYIADDGSRRVAKQWVVQGVDRKRGVLLLRRPRGDKKGTLAMPLQRVTIERRRAWFRQQGAQLSPLHGAILDFAEQIPAVDEQPLDLRPLIRGYQALQDRFGTQPPGPLWRRLVGEEIARYEEEQWRREDEATHSINLIKGPLFGGDDWKRLIELVSKLLDPKDPLHHTNAVKPQTVREDLRGKKRWAEEALAKDELRRMFAGDVKPTYLKGNETTIHFDFDDRRQLDNFLHGFARWQAPPTTPRPEGGRVTVGDGKLHLLPGVRGLLRDRPLSMVSMFDPAQRIALEVTVTFLPNSKMLAFDLDGVQIAICSFAPRLWKRRFPPDAPLLDGEEKLPPFAFYGMGRGVAFHDGSHFGRAFPYGNWDWAYQGQGRNFVKLNDRAFLREAKGQLFAFEPGVPKAVIRVERERNFVRLFVNGKQIIERENHEWARRGATSEIDRKIRHGSGRIQILTWTPMLLDDLKLTGTVRERWKAERRAELAKKAAAAKKAAK